MNLVQFHPALTSLLTDIEQVTPHPDNPNNGDIAAICESIEVNGYVAPVIAQRSTGRIVAGNHRYHALKELGATAIPVIWVDMDDTAARRYLLADNRIAALAVTDNALLLDLLDQLAADDGLLGTGYTDADHTALRALAEMQPDYDDHATWPTLTFQVHPVIRRAFYHLTEQAVGDSERFELLLRLAGWNGETPSRPFGH